jgi:Flp pilus assembly protein TadD
VKIVPLAVPVRTMLGGVLARNRKLKEAEEHMQMAAELQPRNAEGQLMLGVFYASVFDDRREDAFAALERAVDLDPNIRGRVAQQEGLDAIRDEPRFKELVA